MEDVGPLVTTFEVPTITFYDGCNFRRAATVFTVPGADDVALKNTFIQEHAPADFDFDSSSACSQLLRDYRLAARHHRSRVYRHFRSIIFRAWQKHVNYRMRTHINPPWVQETRSKRGVDPLGGTFVPPNKRRDGLLPSHTIETVEDHPPADSGEKDNAGADEQAGAISSSVARADLSKTLAAQDFDRQGSEDQHGHRVEPASTLPNTLASLFANSAAGHLSPLIPHGATRRREDTLPADSGFSQPALAAAV